MKEALRYLNNAKEILKSVPIEDNTYTDVKPVRAALGFLMTPIPDTNSEHDREV